MPYFGKESLKELSTCDIKLKLIFNEVIRNFDCSVIQGLRGKQEQDEYFRIGKSKVKWPTGKHNSAIKNGLSSAADVAPYPINWNDRERFYYFAGYVKGKADLLGVKIRWGGDWDSDNDLHDQTFMDLVHFELVD